jgi:hypothetical protein
MENRPMMRFFAAAALVTAIASPSYAQSVKADGKNNALKSYASDTSKSKAKKKSKTTVTQLDRASPSGNPEWDVYFHGEYVGSDPDPRIRWTIRDEARTYYGLRD